MKVDNLFRAERSNTVLSLAASSKLAVEIGHSIDENGDRKISKVFLVPSETIKKTSNGYVQVINNKVVQSFENDEIFFVEGPGDCSSLWHFPPNQLKVYPGELRVYECPMCNKKWYLHVKVEEENPFVDKKD